MSKILALIDGSVYAKSVCGLVGWSASRLALPVEIVHVLERRGVSPGLDLSGNLDANAGAELLKELATLDEQQNKLAHRKGRAILDAGKTMAAAAGATDISTRLRHGDLIETLSDLEAGADLVIVGKRGEAADFAKLHLGSNIERAVRTSKKPVLAASRVWRAPESFLIAYDGGRSAARVVDYVAASPLLKGLKAHILTVGAETPDARTRLDEAARTLREAGFTVEVSFAAGEPEEAIGAKVDAENIGLLVMGAYGHSRIRSLVIGSTTTAMVRRCKIPVLMIR
ncbi:MAG: universal stress protein UspA [Alphaproteobacteria bacterium HGW-Alphaproteobacteria-5]|nr:MAG: universal stress protein UspA [Alphaproteobacteria bacterium HGW-Alphaproteobacteria-5]